MREDEETALASNETEKRRTGACEKARVGGRSERVVREILRAGAEELARVGYEALRVEDVAARAGVAKTTVYRRWPTKPELVAAITRDFHDAERAIPDTGTLRGDLRAMLAEVAAKAESAEGQGIGRMIMMDIGHPEVQAIARATKEEFRRPWVVVLERAILRGELPAGSDKGLILNLLIGPLLTRRFRMNEALDDQTLELSLGIILEGAMHGGAVRR